MRLAHVVAVFTCCAFFAGVAHADDVDLRVDARAAPGQLPKLTLIVNKDLESAAIDVSGDGGSYGLRARAKKGPATSGSTVEFALPHKATGKVAWKGSLTVVFQDGASGSMPLQFSTEVVSREFRFDATSHLDLANDALQLTSERQTSKVEIEVYTDEDVLLVATAQTFDPPLQPGQPVPVSWIPKKKADVLRLHLVVYDEIGSFQSADLFPYSISIPHDDVVFDSGKSVIRAEQEPKLQAALPEIERATKRFGPAMKAAGATVKLFVAGHTDTVGDAGSNRALSQARAKAIAKWFRAHGCPVAVYARGFGEDQPKVATPDNTDEERNRRAEYDVGVNGPTGGTSGWARID
jgi:outer membrane protein OmpA-like peptidoglycan-associated protein